MFYGIVFKGGNIVIAPVDKVNISTYGGMVQYQYVHAPEYTDEYSPDQDGLLVLTCSNPAQLGRCMRLMVDLDRDARKQGPRTARGLLEVFNNINNDQNTPNGSYGIEVVLTAEED